jgi:hypothetical protein
MPARIAGIQARTDASGNIHVSLDSSAPCWNDATKTTLLKLTKSELTPIFKEAREVYSRAAVMDSCELVRNKVRPLL